MLGEISRARRRGAGRGNGLELRVPHRVPGRWRRRDLAARDGALPASGNLLARTGPGHTDRRKRDDTAAQRWVSVEEVAAHLRVARDSVYRWVEPGRLPAHKVGRPWRYELCEVGNGARKVGAERVATPSSKTKTRKRR